MTEKLDEKSYAAEIEQKMKEHDAYGDPKWVYLWESFSQFSDDFLWYDWMKL